MPKITCKTFCGDRRCRDNFLSSPLWKLSKLEFDLLDLDAFATLILPRVPLCAGVQPALSPICQWIVLIPIHASCVAYYSLELKTAYKFDELINRTFKLSKMKNLLLRPLRHLLHRYSSYALRRAGTVLASCSWQNQGNERFTTNFSKGRFIEIVVYTRSLWEDYNGLQYKSLNAK